MAFKPHAPQPHYKALSIKKYAPVVALTVIVTLAVSNFFKGHPISAEKPSNGHPAGGFLPSHPRQQESEDSSRQSPRWELPEEWKRKVVAAIPMSTAGLPWVKAGRSWRRGLRTAFVTDFYPEASMILDGGTHGETFVYINTTNIPYRYYGKAAMVPSMASEHFGDTTYEWMLYGDDDTVWFMDSVIDIVSKLDPNLPWMITDHLWFWRKGINSGPVHPAFDAPRCVPCDFNKTGIDLGPLGFDPPPACPYCTVEKLCKADGRRELYTEEEGQPCKLTLRYPQEGEYLAHGGGGIILSVGLMRMLPVSYMQDCITSKFSPDKVFGGDTLFSHCVLFTGVAPTDPGHFTWDQGFNGFDPGGQLVRTVLDLFYGYLKKGCCDGLCEKRLRALTTLHLRGMHFKEPEAAMEYMRMLVDLRDLYVHVREKGIRAGGHTPLTPSWDNHKVCA